VGGARLRLGTVNRLVRAVPNRYSTRTSVRRIERESTVLSDGTATKIISGPTS
jgi:hypothetical protein